MKTDLKHLAAAVNEIERARTDKAQTVAILSEFVANYLSGPNALPVNREAAVLPLVNLLKRIQS
jgi:hypothetical protein